LLVSELVTNAIKASGVDPDRGSSRQLTQPKLIAMRLSASGRSVIAEVWDSDPNFPQPKVAGPHEESGRGLLLVNSLATRWSYYRPQSNVDSHGRRLWPAQRGKVTWLEVTI
jgi:two-component sensor histidine kinase